MQNDNMNAPDHPGSGGLAVAGMLGASAVALGAFGAHGLKSWLKNDPDIVARLGWWETGTHYHLVHAVLAAVFGMLLTSSLSSRAKARVRVGLLLCVVGIAIFSGSLYVMTITNIRILGAITPLGGLALIGAWVSLVLAGRARR